MNVRTFARTALMGLAALAAFAGAAQTQTLLVTDSADHSAFSGIHKIDVKTGKDLGYVGGLSLRHARAIAILPGSSIAYVGDDEGIKAMNVDSGTALSLTKSTAALGGKVVALRFNPADADLYAVVACSLMTYKVVHFSGVSGNIKFASGQKITSYEVPISLGFSTFGSVEVTNNYQGFAHRDLYTPDLTPISFTMRYWQLGGGFRSSNDSFLRYVPNFYGICGGRGDWGTNKLVCYAGAGAWVGAAEGLSGQVFMLTQEGPALFARTFDTSGPLPKLVGMVPLGMKHDTLTAVAVCIR